MHWRFLAGSAVVLALFFVSNTSIAKRRANWVRPDFASFHVQRIVLAPTVTYDHDADAESNIDAALLRSFSTKGYDWMSPAAFKATLESQPEDSPLSPKAVRDTILRTKEARVDSLTARILCRRLACDAVMSTRVENERSGRPWMRGALVARDGALLWTADRVGDEFVGRTRDRAGRVAAQRAAAQSWVGGLYPILDRWAMDFPSAIPARR